MAIRLAEGSGLPELLRIMAAATVARSGFTVSTSVALPRGMHQLLKGRDVEVVVESDDHWLSRVRGRRITAHRIRLIGGDPAALAEALGGSPDVAVYSGAVTPSGRVEVLPFLHEQAISITNHRFGNPTGLSERVL